MQSPNRTVLNRRGGYLFFIFMLIILMGYGATIIFIDVLKQSDDKGITIIIFAFIMTLILLFLGLFIQITYDKYIKQPPIITPTDAVESQTPIQ